MDVARGTRSTRLTRGSRPRRTAVRGRNTPARVFRRCAALLLACASSLLTTGPAAADDGTPGAGAGLDGCQAVHAGPRTDGAGKSYFELTLGPGGRQSEAVLLANPQPYDCMVTLEAAIGQTAVNSGNSYWVPEEPCSETSCWLSGLPTTVTIPAGGRLTVGFDVSVPSGTPSGQYLAGVIVRPAGTLPAPSTGEDEQVAVSVAARVAIGVAVIVPGPLRPRLEIPAVTLDLGSGTPQLQVHVRNSGNTWEHPAGGARVRVSSGTSSFGVRSNTILAGDVAVLPLPVEGVQRGRWHTKVVLDYGDDQQAVWQGDLDYPAPPARPDGDQASDALPTDMGIPGWVFAVIGALGLLVVALVAVVVAMLRKRRAEERDRAATARAGDTHPPGRVPGGPATR